jgi:hypothetical protein
MRQSLRREVERLLEQFYRQMSSNHFISKLLKIFWVKSESLLSLGFHRIDTRFLDIFTVVDEFGPP